MVNGGGQWGSGGNAPHVQIAVRPPARAEGFGRFPPYRSIALITRLQMWLMPHMSGTIGSAVAEAN